MKNRILQALPAKEYRILAPHLRTIDQRKGMALHEPGRPVSQVYFPETSVISFLSGTAEGETIEICLVGSEGIVGITPLFGEGTTFRAALQISGSALSIPEEVAKREFSRCDALQRQLQKRGLISYNRGVLRIEDRRRLQSAACECYEIILAAYSKLET